MRLTRFEDLEAWQTGRELAKSVYTASKGWKDYSFNLAMSPIVQEITPADLFNQ